MKVDIRAVSHDKNEKEDKRAKFKVRFEGMTTDSQIVKVSIAGEDEGLFNTYPLKDAFSINLTKPQQKLST